MFSPFVLPDLSAFDDDDDDDKLKVESRDP